MKPKYTEGDEGNEVQETYKRLKEFEGRHPNPTQWTIEEIKEFAKLTDAHMKAVRKEMGRLALEQADKLQQEADETIRRFEEAKKRFGEGMERKEPILGIFEAAIRAGSDVKAMSMIVSRLAVIDLEKRKIEGEIKKNEFIGKVEETFTEMMKIAGRVKGIEALEEVADGIIEEFLGRTHEDKTEPSPSRGRVSKIKALLRKIGMRIKASLEKSEFERWIEGLANKATKEMEKELSGKRKELLATLRAIESKKAKSAKRGEKEKAKTGG